MSTRGKRPFGGINTMASSKEYLEFVLEQLSDLDEITVVYDNN